MIPSPPRPRSWRLAAGGGGPPLPTLAAGAWCGAILATQLAAQLAAQLAGGGRLIAAVAAAGAIAALAAAALARPAWPALLLAAALAGVVRGAGFPGDPQELARAQALAGRTLSIAATVADDPRETASGAEVLVTPSAGDFGKVLVRVRGPVYAAYGDSVTLRGVAHVPSRTPDFDRRAYLAQRGAHLEISATAFNIEARRGGPAALPGLLRSRYRAAVEALLPAPHAALLVGVVLGERAGIPPALNRQLIATGLVHLLVLSGLKVAVFARLASAALAPLLGPRAPLPVAGLVALYALVGGATPAAVRAAAMGGLALLAAALGRPTHVWTSLAMTAAVMLAWHPELGFDVGFQLSFLGTAAIILLTPSIEHRLAFLPGLLREPFAVTCAAQVGTLPVMAQGFHIVSPIAPVANAAVLPLLPAMIGAGLLLPALAPLGEAGRTLAIPLSLGLSYLEQVAAALARVPAAALPLPGFPAWAVGVYYGAGGLALAAVRSRGGARRVAAGGAAAVVVAIAACQLPGLLRPEPSAAFLAVGEGQAVLLKGPSGSVLVDGGASPPALAAALGSELPPWVRRLDALIVTGSGRGEVSGLAGLPLEAGLVVLPAADLPGTAWRSVALEQQARGARLLLVSAGRRLSVAGLTLDFLAPEPGVAAGDAGAEALALRARYPSGGSVCLVGPLDPAAQARVAGRLEGRCEYLLVAGGGRSLPAAELLRAARPRALLVSSGGGRLARGLPEALLRRTDQEGTITVRP